MQSFLSYIVSYRHIACCPQPGVKLEAHMRTNNRAQQNKKWIHVLPSTDMQ